MISCTRLILLPGRKDSDALLEPCNKSVLRQRVPGLGRNLRFWLARPDAAPFDPGDAPLALGALLLRAARTDYAGLFSAPATLDAILRRYTSGALGKQQLLQVQTLQPKKRWRWNT